MTSATGKSKTRLLVVEDNAPDIDLLRWALEKAHLDWDLTVVADGGEAMECVAQRGRYAATPLPDIVILDLNLPKHDGLEILRVLRANRAFDAVPVAVLSSSSSPRERAKIEGFGVGRYITKPVDLDEYARIAPTLKQMLAEQDGARKRGSEEGSSG